MRNITILQALYWLIHDMDMIHVWLDSLTVQERNETVQRLQHLKERSVLIKQLQEPYRSEALLRFYQEVV